ncbi:type II toxin-antitoxin system RelE/ParE family toxin [Flavobacterium subsaxonicum]|uniref:type II toxin-antitoxin system RelE/ParE family toxin n=1 Tax=Flavobacterium subsaxonicum TaxID=426226 RepID=UPI000E43A0FF
MNSPNVFWTLEAENDIDAIYEYYFEKSPDAAARIINDIINSAESMVHSTVSNRGI